MTGNQFQKPCKFRIFEEYLPRNEVIENDVAPLI